VLREESFSAFDVFFCLVYGYFCTGCQGNVRFLYQKGGTKRNKECSPFMTLKAEVMATIFQLFATAREGSK
jgi:hypothetical protein